MATIIVGIEDSLRGQDAVALAGDLARATGAEVLAVCAFPYDDDARGALQPGDARAAAARRAEATLARLCEPLSDDRARAPARRRRRGPRPRAARRGRARPTPR